MRLENTIKPAMIAVPASPAPAAAAAIGRGSDPVVTAASNVRQRKGGREAAVLSPPVSGRPVASSSVVASPVVRAASAAPLPVDPRVSRASAG